MKSIENRLLQIKDNNLFREIKYLNSAQDKYIEIDDERYLLMCSNNYLSLSNRKELKEAAINAIKKYGVGTGGSRLTTGSYDIHRKLEIALSKFFNREETIVFNSGFVANVATISSICDEEYTIFSDELNHASIIDGCRLSKAKIVIFKHNDMNDLKKKILNLDTKKSIIITEGVFSMDGDIAAVDEIVKIAKNFNSLVMVDDAHGVGVLGKTGKGILEYFNLNEEVDIYLATLSKAIGTEGGFISGKKTLIDFLKNRARGFIYSTAISVSICNASIKSLELMQSENLSESLSENIKYFKEKFSEKFNNLTCESAIIKIPIGSEKKAVEISNYLFKNNIYLSAIRYPTVKKGEAILRVCLMNTHTKEEIDLLYNIISKFY